jgi:hypothetical protein
MMMQIKITVTFDTMEPEGEYTETELREALCDEFRVGGEIWLIMKDGKEIAAISQDAQ